MKFDGWNDDDVYGPDEDLNSRARRQKLYLQKMRAWCRPGRAVRIHFPNPKHSTHRWHRRICRLVEPEYQHKDDVWVVEFLDGHDERLHIMHTLEFRPLDPLTALACMAE